jgi:hypothetical protein
MPKIHNQNRKAELAQALVQGRTVTDWAKEKQVPERTAYRWAGCREVRGEVEAIRRAALDGAIAGLRGCERNGFAIPDSEFRKCKPMKQKGLYPFGIRNL